MARSVASACPLALISCCCSSPTWPVSFSRLASMQLGRLREHRLERYLLLPRRSQRRLQPAAFRRGQPRLQVRHPLACRLQRLTDLDDRRRVRLDLNLHVRADPSLEAAVVCWGVCVYVVGSVRRRIDPPTPPPNAPIEGAHRACLAPLYAQQRVDGLGGPCPLRGRRCARGPVGVVAVGVGFRHLPQRRPP